MNYRMIQEFPAYEINVEGDVRRRDNHRPILTDRGGTRWAALVGPDGRSKHRTVVRLLRDTFPEESIDLRTLSSIPRDENEWRVIDSAPYLEITEGGRVRTISTGRKVNHHKGQLRFTINGERYSAPVDWLVDEAFNR